jgi:hypothetical protein
LSQPFELVAVDLIRGDGQSLGSDLVESTGIRIGGSKTSDICGGERDGRRVGVKETEGETVGATDGREGWLEVGMSEGEKVGARVYEQKEEYRVFFS